MRLASDMRIFGVIIYEARTMWARKNNDDEGAKPSNATSSEVT